MKTHTTVATAMILAAASPILAQDLDGNLMRDSAELRAGAPDCNHNGGLDSVDLNRPHFSTAIEHLNGVHAFQNNVWDLCPIDFDQDGDPDLALCAFTSTDVGHIALWRNDGGPGLVFDSEILFDNARPTIIKAADLNADGRADLVAADSSFSRVYVLLASGRGSFAPRVTLAGDNSTNGSVGLALGDLDADGDIDIAATSWGANLVNVWRNNADGTFGPRAGFPTSFQPRDVAIGDFTGDSLADLAVANSFYSANPPGANGTVSLLRNTGAAAFTPHATITMPLGNAPYFYQSRPQFVELKDIDHDGDNDLITSSELSNTLAIHLNDGAGAFTLGQRFGGVSIEGDSRDVQVADLDGDGWEEIIWGDPDQSMVAIFRNNQGAFALHQNFATATYGSLYLGVADFSGDGLPDIVSANDAQRTFSILVNKGELDLDAPLHLRPDEYPQNLVFADFNNDDVTDMCTQRSNAAQTVNYLAVYLGEGNAVFSRTPIDTQITRPGVHFARDLNRDGNMDIISFSGHCIVYLGNGNGAFQAPIDSGLTVNARRSVIADLNRDDILDIAWISPGHPGHYLVSMGDGAGRFGPSTSYVMHAEDESVGVGDINNDGAPELFAGFRPQATPPGGILAWLPNNGDGTFGPRQDRFIAGSPLSPAVNAIAVADFDGDGNRDVVASAAGLRLYRNFFGDGALPETPEVVSNTSVSDLFATDVDLDGDNDLYGRGNTGFAASGVVYLNPGSGSFEPPMFFHLYDSTSRSMAVADINNDGRQDLAIRPENSWGTFVFLNHPPFSADTNSNGVPDDCEAPPPCPADFNADQALDSRDFFDFLVAFFVGAADFNGDGSTNSQDLFDFLAAFFEGCEP